MCDSLNSFCFENQFHKSRNLTLGKGFHCRCEVPKLKERENIFIKQLNSLCRHFLLRRKQAMKPFFSRQIDKFFCFDFINDFTYLIFDLHPQIPTNSTNDTVVQVFKKRRNINVLLVHPVCIIIKLV